MENILMSISISESLVDSIIQDEGYRSSVYLDSLGKPTIGYGFLVDALELQEDVCNVILYRKLEKLVKDIKFNMRWFDDMPEKIQDVIINMCYQLGVAGFMKFKKTIQLLKNKQWNRASVEMLNSRWGREQTPQRALRLSKIVKSMEEN
jgi:GH24 family phage-related lysozyme (muramidase)|tara:strand:+ start:102 stop:548 length:447 start_codon:yes stop_codon:yes gene_type:complete